MQFDWTINIGHVATLVTFLAFGLQFYLMVREKLKFIEWVTKQYPPHSHMEQGEAEPLTTSGINRLKMNGR